MDAAAETGFGWARTLWRSLAPFLRPHRRAFAVIGALMAIELALEVGQRKAMSYLIDEAVLKNRFGLLLVILGGLFAAVLVAGAAALLHEWLYSRPRARPGRATRRRPTSARSRRISRRTSPTRSCSAYSVSAAWRTRASTTATRASSPPPSATTSSATSAHRVPWIVILLIQLAVLGLGGWMAVRGELTPGALVAFYLLFGGLCEHLWNVTANTPSLIDAAAGMRRVREVLDETPPDARDPRTERFAGLGEGLRFEDVSFSYEGGEPHLDHVSLAVPRGELAAFVGASGSGKSTALRMLLGLHAPHSGRILVGGVDLQRIPLGEYWSRVSAVFQDSLLFQASIADNIRAGRLDATDSDVARAAHAAEIDEWIDSLPDGYATLVAGDTCSGGQRQRLALARALVRDPDLLVLDEPTSALDAATGAAVMQTLRRIAPGRTVVLVTHQLRDAAEAARIVVFEYGCVAESGTHAELMARDGVYAALWAKQRHSTALTPASSPAAPG